MAEEKKVNLSSILLKNNFKKRSDKTVDTYEHNNSEVYFVWSKIANEWSVILVDKETMKVDTPDVYYTDEELLDAAHNYLLDRVGFMLKV